MNHAILLATSLLAQPSTDISTYVQKGFEDAQFTARVGTANFRELAKINRDFSQSYRFKTSEVTLKEPFKLKMVASVEDTTITFMVVGPTKYTRVPRSNINMKENVAKAPGKRQTIFDFGILAPSLFRDLFDAKFVRMDRATGNAVFDLTYKSGLRDSSRHRVWIDPKLKIVTKREWYAQNRNQNRLMATFTYDQPRTQNGVTLATRVTVMNAENKLAGSATYENMRINTGVADSVFKTN